MLLWQRFECAVGLAVVLDEHKVPNFNHLRIVLVYKFCTCDFCTLVVVAQVDVNFGARSAGALVAHFPEVILLRTVDNAVFRDIFQPEVFGFVVDVEVFLRVATENCHIQTVLVDSVFFGKQIPRKADGVFLEIVAKRPVSKHLEHCVMVGVVSYVLKVVVLSRNAQTFLRVGHAKRFGLAYSEENILELVHSGICKHQGGVALYYHR